MTRLERLFDILGLLSVLQVQHAWGNQGEYVFAMLIIQMEVLDL